MRLRLTSFGICKEIIPDAYIDIEPDNINVGDLRHHLFKRYPALAALNSLAIAIDEEYQLDDYIISSDKELVLIPPVSGG